jgi:hypothetical protein
MDKVKEDVNWSALACLAFDKKLGEIASTKENQEMADIVQRLRASKQQNDGEANKNGFDCGEGWAARSAEASELERLERQIDSLRTDCQMWLDGNACSAYGPCESLVFAMHPESDGDREFASDFWESLKLDGEPWNDAEFVRGFAEGAMSIWLEVKNQI